MHAHDVDGTQRERIVLADWHDRGHYLEVDAAGARDREIVGLTVSMTQPASPSVAVMGAGAVGCFYGGMLALAGTPVTLIGRPQHVDAVKRDGLAIERAGRRDVVRVDASTDAQAVSSANVVLVCVKSPATADAAREMKPYLRPDSVVVSLQNGVENAQRIAEVVDQVVLAAVVWVGTYMEAPGIVRHSGGGNLVLGVPRDCASRPGAAARAREVAALFEQAGVSCPVADDVDAALWSKLVVNCAFNAVSALGRARYGRMAREPAIRDSWSGRARVGGRGARNGIALDEQEMIATAWRTADAFLAVFVDRARHPARQAHRDRRAERLCRTAREEPGSRRARQSRSACPREAA